ncbi:MAG: S-methyl-5'-thioadenosine phosphorylase [bacterium]
MKEVKIGVIGGSGVYQIEGLTDMERAEVDTPFGKPSDTIFVGTISGRRVAFLPRHGRGHIINPTELNSRANIWAMKSLGVNWIVAVSAVGSLREEIAPLHMVIPDQIYDRTKSRVNTFFGEGLVVHTSFAEPFCPVLSQKLYEAALEAGAIVHKGGTYVCMEGPLFSTKAESHIYRQLGCDIIGMTALPEAKLAREAEISYAMLAMSTDYDCWREGEEVVTAEMVVNNMKKNVALSQKILRAVIPKIPERHDCACASALKFAIQSDPKYIPEATKKKYALLVGKYLK